ncbi:hypothetical protein K439DRAFT_1368536 [Ramaria rubella]|nr:hypothetical protein K439DRAFT_1368536 [Ramaria rubella]
MYLAELQDWLALEHEVLVALPTLDRNIREAGLTYKLLQRAVAERDDEARAAWRADMQANFVTSMLICVDESSKDENDLLLCTMAGL